MLGSFYDAHRIGLVGGLTRRGARHNPKPASFVCPQTAAQAQGQFPTGERLVVYNCAVSLRYIEGESIGAVIEVDDLVRMINSELLSQHQLAECAPARTACVGADFWRESNGKKYSNK